MRERAPETNAFSEDPTLASPREPSREAEERTFAPGELLCGRFRIVRFIARGGMGQVYEAEDREVRQRVALKTIRPALAETPHAIERFRREIQLSRRITHPNVCRVFDLFRHAEPETGSSCVFLTMELLEGETLAARLGRQRRVNDREGREIAEQIALALEAAHAAGVVHRDLKPQNVVLTASDHGIRAVVTDFGLARESSTEATVTDAVVGTVAYMAPEQLEGKDASTASDIYAFGLVLYEMLTGKRPFGGETPFDVAAKRLHQQPPSPRAHLPELSGPWEVAILRCLERDPSRRFESPRHVVRALDGEAATSRRCAKVPKILGGAVLAGALAFAFMTRPEHRTETSTAIDIAPARPSVAMLGFKNLTGRPEASWLSTALSEMLTTELAVTEKLRVVPGELVARTKVNLSLDEAESYAPDTLAHIRQQLGTNYVIIGSYVVVGSPESDRIRLDVRVQDTAHGEILTSVSEVGSEAELFELVADAGASLRKRMGADVRLRGDGTRLLPRSPESVEAAKLYAVGVARRRAYDYRGAREALAHAVALDPDHALAHAALAELLAVLGHHAPALAAAERAVAVSGALPREDRLVIDARYRSLQNETEASVRIARSLVSLFPDDVNHQLRLARALADDAQLDQAFATLEPLFGPGAHPRVFLVESIVAEKASDPSRQLASARRAAARARAIGDELSLAEARVQEASLSPEFLTRREALRALEEARKIYRDVGDRLAEATVLHASLRVKAGPGE